MPHIHISIRTWRINTVSHHSDCKAVARTLNMKQLHSVWPSFIYYTHAFLTAPCQITSSVKGLSYILAFDTCPRKICNCALGCLVGWILRNDPKYVSICKWRSFHELVAINAVLAGKKRLKKEEAMCPSNGWSRARWGAVEKEKGKKGGSYARGVDVHPALLLPLPTCTPSKQPLPSISEWAETIGPRLMSRKPPYTCWRVAK